VCDVDKKNQARRRGPLQPYPSDLSPHARTPPPLVHFCILALPLTSLCSICSTCSIKHLTKSMQAHALPGGAPPLPLHPGVSRACEPAGVELPRRRNCYPGRRGGAPPMGGRIPDQRGWSSPEASAASHGATDVAWRRWSSIPAGEPPRPSGATRPGAGLLR
jgi:hypothetical protein